MAAIVKNLSDSCSVKSNVGSADEYAFKVEGNHDIVSLIRKLRLIGKNRVKVTYPKTKSEGETIEVRNVSSKTGNEMAQDLISQLSDTEKAALTKKDDKVGAAA